MVSRVVGLLLIGLTIGLIGLKGVVADPPPGVPTPGGNPVPEMPKPFAHWPTDRQPDVVIVLSGQSWGYLRPCGCSQKQLGGLERRQNLMEALRTKGWTVTAVDLGDITALSGLPDQVALKYQTMMQSLRTMGYLAVGIGPNDFARDLDALTSKYSLQPGNEKPRLLAANLVRQSVGDRVKSFVTAPNEPPYIDDVVSAKVGAVAIGVVGTIDSTKNETIDKPGELFKSTQQFTLLGNQAALAQAKAKLDADPLKPTLRVLLYQGSRESAEKVASAYKEYQIVLCQSDDALPPLLPDRVNDGKTAICQVGHKGQYVGVAGAFKQSDGSFRIEYQLIDLSEDYLTPKDPEAEKKHAILPLLQKYADQVRDEKYLEDAVTKKVRHNTQVRVENQQVSYIGSNACRICHPQEHDIFEKTKHSEAMKFLGPKYANRPIHRNFDPECVVCHVVGFENKTGYETELKTPHLSHVGCESCHGPGSAHAKDPENRVLLEYLSPWKTRPGDRLPGKDTLAEIGKTDPLKRSPLIGRIELAQQQVIMGVTKQCMTCHDPENDPKFDLYEYMPKIWHSGFKAKK